MLHQALLLTLLAAPSPASGEVIARVGGEAILASSLQQARQAGARGTPLELVEGLISDALLVQEGYRSGLQHHPAVRARVDAERGRFAAERMVQLEVGTPTQPTEAELREAFHAQHDSVVLEQVVCRTKDEAQALVARLEKGADFARAAAASLDKDAAKRGGLMPRILRGDLEPALARDVFSRSPGALIGPLPLGHLWIVARVKARVLADEAAFAEQRAGLEVQVKQRRLADRRSALMTRLRAQGNVRLDEKVLADLGDRKPGAKERRLTVAQVHGRPIRLGAVEDELARISRLSGGKTLSGGKARLHATLALVERMLLEQAALKRGLGKAPEVTLRLDEVERGAVMQAMLKKLRGSVAPPATEVEAYYQGHLVEFRRPSRRPCAHVVVKTKGEAERLARRLQKGESFEALAKKHSLDPASAKKGGSIGELDDEQLGEVAKAEPPIAAVVRETPAGKVSIPVPSRAGWRLVRCGEMVAAGLVPFEEVRDVLAERLGRSRADETVRAKLAEIRGRTQVTIDQGALARVPPGK